MGQSGRWNEGQLGGDHPFVGLVCAPCAANPFVGSVCAACAERQGERNGQRECVRARVLVFVRVGVGTTILLCIVVRPVKNKIRRGSAGRKTAITRAQHSAPMLALHCELCAGLLIGRLCMCIGFY